MCGPRPPRRVRAAPPRRRPPPEHLACMAAVARVSPGVWRRGRWWSGTCGCPAATGRWGAAAAPGGAAPTPPVCCGTVQGRGGDAAVQARSAGRRVEPPGTRPAAGALNGAARPPAPQVHLAGGRAGRQASAAAPHERQAHPATRLSSKGRTIARTGTGSSSSTGRSSPPEPRVNRLLRRTPCVAPSSAGARRGRGGPQRERAAAPVASCWPTHASVRLLFSSHAPRCCCCPAHHRPAQPAATPASRSPSARPWCSRADSMESYKRLREASRCPNKRWSAAPTPPAAPAANCAPSAPASASSSASPKRRPWGSGSTPSASSMAAHSWLVRCRVPAARPAWSEGRPAQGRSSGVWVQLVGAGRLIVQGMHDCRGLAQHRRMRCGPCRPSTRLAPRAQQPSPPRRPLPPGWRAGAPRTWSAAASPLRSSRNARQVRGMMAHAGGLRGTRPTQPSEPCARAAAPAGLRAAALSKHPRRAARPLTTHQDQHGDQQPAQGHGRMRAARVRPVQATAHAPRHRGCRHRRRRRERQAAASPRPVWAGAGSAAMGTAALLVPSIAGEGCRGGHCRAWAELGANSSWGARCSRRQCQGTGDRCPCAIAKRRA